MAKREMRLVGFWGWMVGSAIVGGWIGVFQIGFAPLYLLVLVLATFLWVWRYRP